MMFNKMVPDEVVLKELGERIKAARIRLNMRQEAFADEAGISRPTISRLELGKSVQMTSLIRVLRVLGYLENLDVLLPSTKSTPIELLEMAKKGGKQKRQRVSPNKNASVVVRGVQASGVLGQSRPKTKDSGFIWGEDKKK